MESLGRILGLDQQALMSLGLQLVNTFVMVFILVKLLYKPVGKFLSNRVEKIKNNIMNAETQLKDAETLKVGYEEKLKNIEKERSEILDSARKRAIESEKEIIDAAKAEAETIKKRALLDIDREQMKAREELKGQVVEISTLMASKYIAAAMDANTQNKLLNEVISELGEVKWHS